MKILRERLVTDPVDGRVVRLMSPNLLRPTGSLVGGRVWPVDDGYNLVAKDYDQWYWQAFWRANEVPLITREIGAHITSLTALDAGTGTGQYLGVLQRKGYRSAGLDISGEMLRKARKNLGTSARLVRGMLEAAPFLTGAFDLVVACRVLSHVERLDEAMKELARVTKLGGRLLLADVSAQHNYVTTRIPTRAGDVHIETFKHDIPAVLSNARRFEGWQVERMENVRFCELIEMPDPAEYPSIDASSSSPIFFYCAMRRT
jgi:ubiquinone/menaquinone biosynthesis C-methylase UbiE